MLYVNKKIAVWGSNHTAIFKREKNIMKKFFIVTELALAAVAPTQWLRELELNQYY